jgi:DNA-directed RNA polymerase specialized sigma24 family protein
MKTRDGSAFARTRLAEEQTLTVCSSIDALADEIFARLKDDNGNNAVDEDLQDYLFQAASTLVRPTDGAEALVRSTLQELPPNQRDVLLMHLGGLTYVQIAQRQAMTHQAVLKDLTSAYVRLRFALNPMNPGEVQTSTDR